MKPEHILKAVSIGTGLMAGFIVVFARVHGSPELVAGLIVLAIAFARIGMRDLKFPAFPIAWLAFLAASCMWLSQCVLCQVQVMSFEWWAVLSILIITIVMPVLSSKAVVKTGSSTVEIFKYVCFLGTICSPVLMILHPKLCAACLTAYGALCLCTDQGQVLTDETLRRPIRFGWVAAGMLIMAVAGARIPSHNVAHNNYQQSLVGAQIGQISSIQRNYSGIVMLSNPGCHYCELASKWIEEHRIRVMKADACWIGNNAPCWDPSKSNFAATPTFLLLENGLIRREAIGWGEESQIFLSQSQDKHEK